MKTTSKTIKKATARMLAVLGMAAMLVCSTGCNRQATQNSVAIGKNIDIRTNLTTIETPKEAGLYSFTSAFADIDPEGLAKLFLNTNEVTTSEETNGVHYHRADDPDQTMGGVRVTITSEEYREQFLQDGHWTDPVAKAVNITFSRSPDWNFGTLYVGDFHLNFRNFGFSAEQGFVGEVLAEDGAGDPKMEAALAQSKAIMDYMQYDDYQLVIANKYSKESVQELTRLMGGYGEERPTIVWDPTTGKSTYTYSGRYLEPDTELYFIQYNIIPATLPEGIDTSDPNYFLKAQFHFDKDGLFIAAVYPNITFEPHRTGAACTAEEAVRIAQGNEEWDEATLFSADYTLKKITDTTYAGIWELHFGLDVTDTLEPAEMKLLTAEGFKGKYQRMSIYVNAINGAKLDMSYDRRMQLGVFPVLAHKYNFPELFEAK